MFFVGGCSSVVVDSSSSLSELGGCLHILALRAVICSLLVFAGQWWLPPHPRSQSCNMFFVGGCWSVVVAYTSSLSELGGCLHILARRAVICSLKVVAHQWWLPPHPRSQSCNMFFVGGCWSVVVDSSSSLSELQWVGDSSSSLSESCYMFFVGGCSSVVFASTSLLSEL
ncbi:hypothetical protein DPMN_010099 [Dreissena polymorpha]|uniref:Uncharacterized protein n=1 Tax=Dreissena polymorpha TaxID=45954 RepID=A0A9D4MY65_DREPO|nr:hypothetical protein DPMN_010099 [Dreissena polymorpha]